MTLDEAIKHAEEVAERNEKTAEIATPNKKNYIRQCNKCAAEHRQLAEWLKDYKRMKEQEPTTKNDLGVDCISRQAVLEGIAEWIADGYADSEADCSHISSLVTHLPSVTPQEPKTGHWKDIPKYKDIAWCCSECERFTTMKHNYCPKCGAKMVEPQESEAE